MSEHEQHRPDAGGTGGPSGGDSSAGSSSPSSGSSPDPSSGGSPDPSSGGSPNPSSGGSPDPSSDSPSSGSPSSTSPSSTSRSGGRPAIDPRKVMEDALSAIVNRGGHTSGDVVASGAESAGSAAGAGPAGDRPKRKRKRKRRGEHAGDDGPETPGQGGGSAGPRDGGGTRRPPPRGGATAPAHARDAVDALSLMARKLLDAKKVHFLSRPRFMELTVKVPLDARADGGRCASQLVEQVLERIEDVQSHDNAWKPGAVYCYFNDSSAADGCRPSEPRQVFDGYGSTGRPKFTDFVTMAIERKAKGIEALVGGEDVTLTHVSQGRVLRTAQLAEFGKASPVFRILGQVDAGLFAVRGQESKAAFSLQILLGKGLEGQPNLRLHPVGHCDMMNLLDHSVPQILLRFQRDLDDAALRLKGMQSNGDAPDEEEFVLPLLQDLAKRLEDRAKHRSRRTEHADRRSEQGTRPTTKAYDDAQQVADTDLLWDDTEGTVVVVGRNNRVHVFTPEGRHVTSLASMHRGMVQQRVKANRWRHTEPEERGEFRMQLRQMVKSHREQTERTIIEKKERREQRGKGAAPGVPRVPAVGGDSGHLQSKIAQLMSGLGGGGATPAAETPAAEAPASEAPANETPATEATAAETPATEATAAETPATETPAAGGPGPAAEVKVAEIKAAPPPATDEIRASTTDATRSEGADS